MRFLVRHVAFALIAVSSPAALWSCGSTTADGALAPTTTTIGPGGGVAASLDHRIEVAVPAGALDAPVAITIATTAGPSGGVGFAFDVGPSGTTFKIPVTITLRYTDSELAGRSASSVRVGLATGATWQALTDYATDPAARVISGTTTHLSTYGLYATSDAIGTNPNPTPPNSGGEVCLSTSASGPCGPSACGSLPGSTVQACAQTGPSSSEAQCCWPPGVPVCAQLAMNNVSCPQVCSTWTPAASPSSCSQNGSTTNATCCLPPGTNPPPLPPSSTAPDGGSGTPKCTAIAPCSDPKVNDGGNGVQYECSGGALPPSPQFCVPKGGSGQLAEYCCP